MSKQLLLTSLLIIFGLYILTSCVSSGITGSDELLSRDYSQMTDAELTRYEQELSDELARLGGSSSGDVSIGFGFGSWGNGSGIGVHTSQRVGGAGTYDRSVELRNRRDQVRMEMRRRGLL